jgi:hypothetical protein
MKVLYAARFATIAFLLATLYTWFQMQPGLSRASELLTRQVWVVNHPFQWNLGWWLWLLAIFSWMLLLVALLWSFLPAHRLASMLQSGLIIIAAVLTIAGVIVWMAGLPVVFNQPTVAVSLVPVVDALALGLASSGCFMGGAATAWIAWDLIQQKVLSPLWLWLALVAGLVLLPTPFLALHPYILGTSLGFWLAWCFWLSAHRRLPSPFPVWPL